MHANPSMFKNTLPSSGINIWEEKTVNCDRDDNRKANHDYDHTSTKEERGELDLRIADFCIANTAPVLSRPHHLRNHHHTSSNADGSG